MTTVRDLASEAHQWRSNLRPTSPLVPALTSVSSEGLIEAYQLWWTEYTSGVRESPTAMRVDGVSAYDAKNAADAANTAVLELLRREV